MEMTPAQSITWTQATESWYGKPRTVYQAEIDDRLWEIRCTTLASRTAIPATSYSIFRWSDQVGWINMGIAWTLTHAKHYAETWNKPR